MGRAEIGAVMSESTGNDGGAPVGTDPCGCGNGQVVVFSSNAPQGTTENCGRCGGTGRQ